MARRGFLEVRRCVSSTWWRVCKAILYCVALVDNGWTNVGLNLVADTFNSLSRVRSRNLVFYRRSGASGSGILRKLPRGDQAPAHNINNQKKHLIRTTQPRAIPHSRRFGPWYCLMVNVQFIFIFIIHGVPQVSQGRGGVDHI
jgi:hypothetical protein